MENKLFEHIVREGIENPIVDLATDYAEIGLETFLDNDLVKEIPVVKTIVGLIKGGLKIKEVAFVKKFILFLQQYHRSQISTNKKIEFLTRYNTDTKYRASVVEQLMILNDKFIRPRKSQILGNLFAAHINGQYDWETFIALSCCLEKLELTAIPLFEKLEKEKEPFHKDYAPADNYAALLVASGLAIQWGTHLMVTPFGIYIYEFGIKGNINCDIESVLHRANWSIDKE